MRGRANEQKSKSRNTVFMGNPPKPPQKTKPKKKGKEMIQKGAGDSKIETQNARSRHEKRTGVYEG